MTAARLDVVAERRRLEGSSAAELRRRYQEIGGDEARSRNREYLVRRILWMLQAGAYGGLSERGRHRPAHRQAMKRGGGRPALSKRAGTPF